MEGTAAVVGAGPNGLAAAVVLARAGLQVTVHEAADRPGGALRSAALLGEGTLSDLGAAVHPLGVASPLLSRLPLEQHGLAWMHPDVPLAHPLDGQPAALLHRSLQQTAEGLGRDGRAWRLLHEGAVRRWQDLLPGVLGPLLRIPEHPLAMASFGARGAWPASVLARTVFREQPARALFAGSAAHAVLPLSFPATAGFGLLLGAAGHATGWPVARGGTQAIADALVSLLEREGGTVRTGHLVTDLAEVRPADVVLLDLAPASVLRLLGRLLPPRYVRRLENWRPGAGSYKLDYLLDGPVPWADPQVAHAGTVHLGGTLPEIADAEAQVHAGRLPDRPYVLVAQQSLADPTRVPPGRQLLWAYAHVPPGSTAPYADRIEAQLERFAPGFRDRVLGRVVTTPGDLQAWDANLVGGDVGGGSMSGLQGLRLPYEVPLSGVFMCSASTPPGGGAHGMAGFHAAQAALHHLAGRPT